MGLCFSVPKNIKCPPSLKNIYNTIYTQNSNQPKIAKLFDFPDPMHGDLTNWTKNGVLLLNASLTVKKNEPKSHFNYGWVNFTD